MLVSVHESLLLLHGDMCAVLFDRSEQRIPSSSTLFGLYIGGVH